MSCNSSHAHCIFCGQCLTCQPHPAHTGKDGNPR